jgi:capsular exopolysaccharide synthesis family protein
MSRIFEALRQSELETQQEAGIMPALPERPLETPTMPSAQSMPAAAAPAPAPSSAAEPALPAIGGAALDLARLGVFTPKPSPAGNLVAMTDERGLGAEKFRVLATRLANIRRTATLKVLQITSSTSGEGKTLVGSNLAVTLAKRSGQTVLLIEGDLRKPAICSLFGLPTPVKGLGDWWREKNGSIVPFLQRVADSTLCLLPSGAVQHPVALLQSGRMADLMQQLAGWFDWIIVDAPPMLPMADANLWARLADGTLLVIREGTVRRHALQSAVDSMDSPKLVGLVLNDAVDYDRADYDSYYAYPGKSPGSKAKSKVPR